MDYIGSILKKPSLEIKPEEAILILGDRLQNSKFPADRRSAVLGLKSFSRQYREVVVEYASKALLKAIVTDCDDVGSIKAILETLLLLFMKGADSGDAARGWISSHSRFQNGKYPSPLSIEDFEVDQFSLWIADEFSVSPQYLSSLMDSLLSHSDFHVRSYAIQLLEALLLTRPVKLRDLFTMVPSSISLAVNLLNDEHDQIRNEAILLLMALVKDNNNIQKIVAFENTFEILFNVIKEEGGVRGSIIVQDCLTLLFNLLAYNASNQKYFLETGCIPVLVELLSDPFSQEFDITLQLETITWHDQRVSNMKMILEICRTFVEKESHDFTYKQNLLFEHGVFIAVLKIAFTFEINVALRSLALRITGDLMAGNHKVQFEFSKFDVPSFDPSLPIGNPVNCLAAPQALLNWALHLNSVHYFSIRLFASYCFQCFVERNKDAKLGFLEDQIRSFESGSLHQDDSGERKSNIEIDKQSNIISILLHYDDGIKLNSYKPWFAAFFMMCLIEDCEEAKRIARAVTVGNEKDGEEVMCFIQAIAQILVTTLHLNDSRIPVAYTSLLSFWLYEDFESVDDFLRDIDSVKAIMSAVMSSGSNATDLADCTCFILIGIAFEFSRNSSPCPRLELHNIIVKTIGADNYALKVKKMFHKYLEGTINDLFTQEITKDETGLPKVFLIPQYLHLLQDNAYRIRLALLHDPQRDPILKVTYEMFEDLREEHESLKASADARVTELEDKLKDSRQSVIDLKATLANAERKLTSVESEVQMLRKSNEEIKTKNEDLSSRIKMAEELQSKLSYDLTKCKGHLEHTNKEKAVLLRDFKELETRFKEASDGKQLAENGINKMNKELRSLTESLKTTEAELEAVTRASQRASKQSQNKIQQLTNEVKRFQDNKLGNESKSCNNADELQRAQQNIHHLQMKLNDSITEKDQKAYEAKTLMEKLKSAALIVNNLKKLLSDKESELAEIRTRWGVESLQRSEYDDVVPVAANIDSKARGSLEVSTMQGRSIESSQRSCSVSHDLKTTIDRLRLQNEELKVSMALEKDRLRTLQGDFDELMLLWENLMAKISFYKKRLIELHENVSGDEDEASTM